MTDIVSCPHCKQLVERNYYVGSYGIEEEHIDCKCGYSYMFAYGDYVEQLPGQVALIWRHDAPEKIPYVNY